MTQKREFKQLVRARMKKTGERYSTARAHLLVTVSRPAASDPGALEGYPAFGGVQGDTAALLHALQQAGVQDPSGRRISSEALLFGICGGIGFLYAVFEYQGYAPMLTVAMRHDTMPTGLIAGGLERLAAKTSITETSSAAKAARALDAALESGQAALCVVDLAQMPYLGMPEQMIGMCPGIIGVAGRDGDDVLIDDRRTRPHRMPIEELSRARAGYKKAKQRLITIEPGTRCRDLSEAALDAVRATAHRFRVSPFKGFASNFGFAGLEKWQRLLIDPKDKKGWPKQFFEGGHAALALRRTFEGIELEYTAPAGSRPLYADFLDEAAELTGRAELRGAAALFRESGVQWRSISESIASCGDDELERACATTEQRAELMDSEEASDSSELRDLWSYHPGAAARSELSVDRAAAICESISETLGRIREIEEKAVQQLESIGE
ncbi:MAG: DUF4872 domain-containing protein [Planctomycetota bacterium]